MGVGWCGCMGGVGVIGIIDLIVICGCEWVNMWASGCGWDGRVGMCECVGVLM